MTKYFYFSILILLLFNCSQKYNSEYSAISSDGVHISFSEYGSNEPAIIFVHGWSNNRTIWDEQLTYFSKKYTVIGIDLAGFGKSGNNRNAWTMSSFGDDVIAVIDKLKLEKVILVGFSMGGPVIVEAANKLPEHIKGLVLVDTMQDPYQKYPPEAIAYIDSVFMDIVTNLAPEKLEGVFYKKNNDTAFARIQKMLDGASHVGWRESLHENARWMNEECIKKLKSLRVPIVAINSDTQPTNIEGYKVILPSFNFHMMEDVGHVVFWDKPEEFNKLLEESVQDFMMVH